MFKENTVYKEDLPIEVIVADVKDYPIHFHDDPEIIYVLEGKLEMKIGHYEYHLKAGDVFMVNRHEIHSLISDGEENMIMMVSLDSSYFSRYYEEFNETYFVPRLKGREDSMNVIRGLLGAIMNELLQKGVGYERKAIETTHNLISTLMAGTRHFNRNNISEDATLGMNIASRLNRITDRMYENYAEKLTLSEIAEQEGLSIYYLSHVIKESTGLNFQDLLSYIRVEKSEKLLLNTDKKIGVIATEMGFSAVRYYVKHFETWYGMHPSEYREKYAGQDVPQKAIAVYERTSPDKIADTIKRMSKEAYGEMDKKEASAPEIVNVDIDISSENIGDVNYEELESFMERDNMKFIARPFNLIKSLQEPTLAADFNHIITAHEKYKGELTGLSILVYNFDEETRDKLADSDNAENDFKIVSGYDRDVEFLIRCNGISGDFNISRYILTKENIEVAYAPDESGGYVNTKRDMLLNNWKTLPSLEFGKLSVSDTLSLSLNLSGMSAELILIDRA